MNRALPLTLAVAAALTLAACGDFPDVTTVVDLRVLAVRTEPSEIILSVTDPTANPPVIDPASNPPITVTPLLVDGAAGRGDVTWTLVGCPNNPFGAAPPAGMGGAMLGGGARTSVGSSLCPDGGALTWPLVTTPVAAGSAATVVISPDQLAAAFKSDIFPDQFGNFHGGFDLGEPLTLQLTATDGVQTVTAIKRVLYWAQKISDEQKPNQTPEITEVSTFAERDETTFDPIDPITPLVEGTPQPVSVGGHLWVQPNFVEPESYVTTVIDPDTHLAVPSTIPRERLRYAFYATAGKFDPARRTSELPIGFVSTGSGRIPLESKYTPPATVDNIPTDDMGRHIVTIWIVVRDERAGESWVTRQLEIR